MTPPRTPPRTPPALSIRLESDITGMYDEVVAGGLVAVDDWI